LDGPRPRKPEARVVSGLPLQNLVLRSAGRSPSIPDPFCLSPLTEPNPMAVDTISTAPNQPITPIHARQEALTGVPKPKSPSAGGRSRAEWCRSTLKAEGDRRVAGDDRLSSDRQGGLQKPKSDLWKAVIDLIGASRSSEREVAGYRRMASSRNSLAAGPPPGGSRTAPTRCAQRPRPRIFVKGVREGLC